MVQWMKTIVQYTTGKEEFERLMAEEEAERQAQKEAEEAEEAERRKRAAEREAALQRAEEEAAAAAEAERIAQERAAENRRVAERLAAERKAEAERIDGDVLEPHFRMQVLAYGLYRGIPDEPRSQEEPRQGVDDQCQADADEPAPSLPGRSDELLRRVGQGREDSAVRPNRPRRQAHDRSDRLRGQDHPPPAGGRPQARRL